MGLNKIRKACNYASLWWFRPSRLLGLLIFGDLLIFFLFVAWENYFLNWQLFKHDAPKLAVTNWLFLIGVVSAIAGWGVSASITLRNSIKQHTINTLLQSRLSATYMTSAGIINKNFFAPGMPDEPIAVAHLKDAKNFDELAAVHYVLNYMEFLAVGIRHGDLDELVLRHTMKGIVVRLHEKTSLYLNDMRGEVGTTTAKPSNLEHLTWLYNKWKKIK